ncbi:uncharacterized protein EAE97_010920 [Botrytis byssoidea]|uniref:Uncharacterized protein n=1 Tax=Botrytis byssoidea TaxID=139641 RepID=A0A9P5HUJ4_9HELO|nr:uncharacterized protein EAE97_010920 [Botrytis byssoidea]KAF7923482.1 hypothetical protein EAE97_010920 [Botrytis byssoidea]
MTSQASSHVPIEKNESTILISESIEIGHSTPSSGKPQNPNHSPNIGTGSAPPPPPPPLPPPPSFSKPFTPAKLPSTPSPPTFGSPNTFLIELLIYNGHPYKDHWAFFIRSPSHTSIGVRLHATGDVRNGFRFEIQQEHNLYTTEDIPTKRIPLQWVRGWETLDTEGCGVDADMYRRTVCAFEKSVRKAEVPGKTLNSVRDEINPGKRITQKDCQSWLVGAADHLVQDGIFGPEIAGFLHAVRQ